MENLVAWRFSLIPTMIVAALIGIFAYKNLSAPFNFAVIAVAVAAIGAHVYFLQRKEKAARFEVFYAAVQDFGTPVSFSDTEASFERNGTVFNAQFPKDEYHTTFIVSFSIAKVPEKFVIHHRGYITQSTDECFLLEPSPLPEYFKAGSRNIEFLSNLLKNQKLLDELNSYPDTFAGRFVVFFEDGYCEIEWTPKANEQIDGFYKICQTAVLFHDELKKLAK
jgi:hypothetical protein